MRVASVGERDIKAPAKAEGLISRLMKLTNPKVAPKTSPLFKPSSSVPTTTGMHSTVILIKPRGISPMGVKPSTAIKPDKSATIKERRSIAVFIILSSVQVSK
jgi:hypothetical protein